MPAVPLWALGRHVTAIGIQTFSAGPDGTLTAGSLDVSMLTIIDEIEIDEDGGAQNVPPLTSNHESMILVRKNDTYTLTQILRPNTGQNTLAAAYYDTSGSGATLARCDYAKITIARAGKQFIDYFLMADYTESIRQGKNVGRMVLMQADSSGDATIGYTNA